jgi:hypothetical protein
MTVPDGKTIHIGRRAYAAGATIPDETAKAAGIVVPDATAKAAVKATAASTDGSSTK